MSTNDVATSRRPTTRRPMSWLYLSLWLFAATMALGYLATLMGRPAELQAARTKPVASAASVAAAKAEAARLTVENQDLRKALATAEQDLVKTKSAVAAQQEREAALAARVAALEQQGAAPAGKAAEPEAATQTPVAAAPAPKAASLARAAEARAQRTTAQPPSAALRASEPATVATAMAPVVARPNLINARATPATTPIATGSIAQAPITFGPATVTPAVASTGTAATAPAAINLGAGPSLDALRLSWSLLNERHSTVLKSYTPRYAAPAGDTQAYQLMAGPIASTQEAQRVCEQLKARRVACTVASFGGEGL